MKNFGKIKNAVNNVLVESILKENSKDKSHIRKYLSEIKKNNILRRQYLIYSNIEEANINDRTEAFEFIKENLSYLDDIHPQSIFNENTKFTKKLNEEMDKELQSYIEYKDNDDVKEVHENLSKLIHLQKNPSNLNERTNLMSKVADFIQNNQKKEIKEDTEFIKDQNVPSDVLIKFAADKFNKKYNNLNESEKKIVKTIINGNEDEKKKVFEDTKKECVDEIDKMLEESNDDLETKNKLLKAKDRLLRMEYDADSFPKTMNKMLTLKK